MFVRNVSLRLKPNTLSEFTRIFEKEVIPMLRKQSGFRDEIAFAVPGELDVEMCIRDRSLVPGSGQSPLGWAFQCLLQIARTTDVDRWMLA